MRGCGPAIADPQHLPPGEMEDIAGRYLARLALPQTITASAWLARGGRQPEEMGKAQADGDVGGRYR